MRIPVLSKLLNGRGHGAELLRGSTLAALLRVAGALVTYVFNFLVARAFGASAVGALALATTVITVIGVLSRLGFDRSIVWIVFAV